MSIIKTSSAHRGNLDHFEPENSQDAGDQRRLRGHLEQIDFAAFAANKAVMAHDLGPLSLDALQRLAVAAANARAQWLKLALDGAATGRPLSREEIDQLAGRRAAFDELCEAYNGLRRTIERGYVSYRAAG
jgi:hypothetical protein